MRTSGGGQLYRVALTQGVWRVVDHAVGGFQALVDDQAFAQVQADVNVLQVHVILHIQLTITVLR